ncbi:hypothetical protein OPV22_002059 [Ensete ventricosum]|uniref:Secreted protein n=1 Tax=Ensete ventricosum TaxID=4639 RepID=A0AAV8RWU6_ENSVE|nr:hypothetical protein OPV22_002059 [Ensete ventricosum]
MSLFPSTSFSWFARALHCTAPLPSLSATASLNALATSTPSKASSSSSLLGTCTQTFFAAIRWALSPSSFCRWQQHERQPELQGLHQGIPAAVGHEATHRTGWPRSLSGGLSRCSPVPPPPGAFVEARRECVGLALESLNKMAGWRAPGRRPPVSASSLWLAAAARSRRKRVVSFCFRRISFI